MLGRWRIRLVSLFPDFADDGLAFTTTSITKTCGDEITSTHKKHETRLKVLRQDIHGGATALSGRDKMPTEPRACIAINTHGALAAVLLRPVDAHVHIPNAASQHGCTTD